MQLFITSNFSKKNNILTITDERILHQVRHVLRMQTGHHLQIQNHGYRYTISITLLTKTTIQGTIIDALALSRHQTESSASNMTTLLIAYPNRRDKAELIIQKLTEIGIDKIIFTPLQRSIIRSISDKKQSRSKLIALEASEQSFRYYLPELLFLDSRDETHILGADEIRFFHQNGEPCSTTNRKINHKVLGIIGPEGGFTDNEIEFITAQNHQKISLGPTILRMETAAIIAGRLLSNR